MKQGQDISVSFPGSVIVHQKIRGYEVGEHTHDGHELFLPLQGEIHILAGDRDLIAGPGKMIYMPAGIRHSFKSSPSAQGERLIFMVDRKMWKARKAPQAPPGVMAASQLCKELLFHLLIHPKTKNATSLVITLIDVLSEMLEAAPIQNTGPSFDHLMGRVADERIKKAFLEISAKFNGPLSMDALAKTAALSVRNLNRLFLVETGMTPKQAITMMRITRARELLKSGNFSVTDVSLEVGYQSLSQFISTYRKVTGRLPSEELVR